MTKHQTEPTVVKTKQIVIVLEVDELQYPELVAMEDEELADQLCSLSLDFDADDYETVITWEDMTHLIVRSLEDGDEKSIHARKLIVVEETDERPESHPQVHL
jgi:hypothetical protein